MKKFLSLFLALAMIISCVSMVSFVANAEEATDPVGVKLTAASDLKANSQYIMTSTGVFTAEDVVDNKLTYSFNMYNISSQTMNFQVSLQANCTWSDKSSTWSGPAKSSVSVELASKTAKTYTITIDVSDDNTVGISKTISGEVETLTKKVTELFLRVDGQAQSINIATGASVIFIEDDTNDPIYGLLSNSKFNVSQVYEIPMKELGDGTLEENTYGWGTIHDGSFSAVKDPADQNNTVAKLTPTSSAFSSIFFDLGPYIFNDPDLFYDGNGAGHYEVSFKYKADSETFAKHTGNANFDVDLNSRNHLSATQVAAALPEATYTANTYLASGSITMTTEWQTYTGRFDLNKLHDMLVDLRNNSVANTNNQANTYQFGLRLDGSGSRAFGSGSNFNYFIDDVTVKKVSRNGQLFEITTPGTGYPLWIGGAGLTQDVADENNYITATYDIYNIGENEATVDIQFQAINGWTSFENSTTSVKVAPNSKATATIKMLTDGEGNLIKKDGSFIDEIKNANARIQYPDAKKVQKVLVVPTSEAAKSIYNVKYSGAGNFAGGTATCSEYWGEIPIFATPTPIPDDAAGMKFEVTDDITGGYPYFRTNANITEADFVDGTFTKNFVVYNVSDVDLVITIQYQNDWGGMGVSSASGKQLVPANNKKTFTLSFNLNADGTAGTTNAPLEKITFRTQIENKEKGAIPVGAAYIIAAEGGDVIYNIKSGGVYPLSGMTATGSVAVNAVTELPELEEASYAIKGVSVDIGSTLSLKYKVDFGGIDLERLAANGFNLSVDFARNGKTENVVDYVIDEDGYYVFTYEGLNAQCMGDLINARVYLADVVLLSKNGYSVKEYASNLYNSTAADLGISDAKFSALKSLLGAMLNYGAEAQRYIKYNVDDLVNAELDWAKNIQFVAPETENRVVFGNEYEDAKVVSVGLNISNVYKIFFRVAITDEAVKVYLKSGDGEAVEVTEIVDGKVYTDAIKATEADTNFTLTIKSGDDVVSEVTYDVNDYIVKMNGHSEVGAITKAISAYSQAANAFVNAN